MVTQVLAGGPIAVYWLLATGYWLLATGYGPDGPRGRISGAGPGPGSQPAADGALTRHQQSRELLVDQVEVVKGPTRSNGQADDPGIRATSAEMMSRQWL